MDRRLLVVTQSETSDDAVRKFESSMEKLRKLDVAAGYVELLQSVDRLRTECTSQLGKSDEAAMEPYGKLRHLVTSLRPLQDAAEGAAPHLLDYIARQAEDLRQTIQNSFAADLEGTLKKMNWPKPTDTVPLALEKEWSANVVRLLKLQQQDLLDLEHSVSTQAPKQEPPALWALEVMVHALEQRFIYHFSGNKATNRLDKPEYFLHHTTELLSTYSTFLQNAVQPLLVQQFRGTDLSLTPAYIDALSAFITALLPMLKRKLYSFATQVSSQPQLLSHLIHEVMAFDATLQESYSYSPISPSLPWRGLAHFLLDTCGYFAQWLTVERDFAVARYQSIIDASDAGELDYDSVSSEAAKPMKAAVRLNDLLETVTNRYRPLASFSQKMRFLIDIQISIFDRFNLRLRNSLDAFVASSSTIGRTVPGVSVERQSEVQGIKGLDRLCRVFGSADYLERAMRDWSDDVFFLELYEELQARVKEPERVNRHLGDIQEVQQKTSGAIGEDGETDGELQGALFDETAGLYHSLRVRSENMIIEMLSYSLRETLRPYAAVTTWGSLTSASATTGGSAPSAELDPMLRLITEYFGFLGKAVGKLAARRISRQALHAIQNYIWDQVLLRHFFSTAGALQLSTDVATICSHVDRFVGMGQGRAGMRRLVEGSVLLGLPVRGEIPRVQRGKSGEEGEEAFDEDTAWEEDDADTGDGGEKKLGLFEVDRLLFTDNESARQVVRELGLEMLSVGDAREVLKRRVEVRS